MLTTLNDLRFDARMLIKRPGLGVIAIACLSLLGTFDAPVSGQSPEAPSAATVRGGAIDGQPPPVPPAVVSRDAEGRVTLRAIRLDGPLTVDGRLDDQIYQRVPPVSDFIQQEPQEGEPATEQTDAWVFFDDENLYVSARCWDSDPERMIANEMRRDSINIFYNNDFAVILDTFYDRRNGFVFYTNPLGALMDQTFTNERTGNIDWNTVWQPRTARFRDGWTTEIAIPFKSLRYEGAGPQVWGINLRRIVAWKNEHSYLSAVPASVRTFGIYKVSSAATLVGLETPPRSLQLEVKPYAISGVRTDRTARVPVSNDVTGDAGFDVKYGLTQSLTADVTYNTDFAQVEDDEQRINLTRFNLFFPEKREFFLEGRGIFDFGGGQESNAPILFFSRRIGLNRSRAVPIEAGGRLTGKVGPYSIGLLNVQTDEEPVSGARATNFSVVRVKRDVLRRSTIGALMTHRSVSTVGDGSNDVYGVDGTFAFFDNLRIDTYLARTRTPGLSGDDTSYRARLNYNGDRYGVVLDRLAVGDNFNPEVGFLRRDDFRDNSAFLRFSPRPRSIAAVRQFTWSASYNYLTDGTGRLETRQATGSFFTEFENSDGVFMGYTRRYEFVERSFGIARGVTIPVGGYSFQNVFLGYRLRPQRKISGVLQYERGSFFGGERSAVNYFIGRVEITPQISLEPSVSFNWIDLPQGTFTTQVVRTRATYTLTPRMFFTALLQYNSSSGSLSSNLRLRWEYQPGSELFVVYSEGRDTEVQGFPGLENRAFVVKFNRLFRF